MPSTAVPPREGESRFLGQPAESERPSSLPRSAAPQFQILRYGHHLEPWAISRWTSAPLTKMTTTPSSASSSRQSSGCGKLSTLTSGRSPGVAWKTGATGSGVIWPTARPDPAGQSAQAPSWRPSRRTPRATRSGPRPACVSPPCTSAVSWFAGTTPAGRSAPPAGLGRAHRAAASTAPSGSGWTCGAPTRSCTRTTSVSGFRAAGNSSDPTIPREPCSRNPRTRSAYLARRSFNEL